MQITELNEKADDAAELLLAMANEKRLMILCYLMDQERPVNEIAELVGLGQSPLSQHLAKLKAMRLVKARRDGQQVFYSVGSERVKALLKVLYGLYCRTGTGMADQEGDPLKESAHGAELARQG